MISREEREQERTKIMYHVSLFNNEKCEHGMLIFMLSKCVIPPDPSIYSMLAFISLEAVRQQS